MQAKFRKWRGMARNFGPHRDCTSSPTHPRPESCHKKQPRFLFPISLRASHPLLLSIPIIGSWSLSLSRSSKLLECLKGKERVEWTKMCRLQNETFLCLERRGGAKVRGWNIKILEEEGWGMESEISHFTRLNSKLPLQFP